MATAKRRDERSEWACDKLKYLQTLIFACAVTHDEAPLNIVRFEHCLKGDDD